MASLDAVVNTLTPAILTAVELFISPITSSAYAGTVELIPTLELLVDAFNTDPPAPTFNVVATVDTPET